MDVTRQLEAIAQVKTVLGNLAVEVEGADFDISVDGQRFDAYPWDGPPDVHVVARCGSRPADEWRESRIRSMRGIGDGRVLEAELTEWRARLDTRACRVTAEIDGRWPLAVGSLLKLVAQVYPLILGRGLVLHAAAVEREGNAYVFMGRSGAGKTTVALLSREAGLNALAEEMTYVGPAADGTPHVFTMPFRQRGMLSPEPACIPVAGVYWLEQAVTDEVVAVSHDRQLVATVRCAAVGVRHISLMEAALDPCRALVREVPVKVLRFRRGVGFWDTVLQDGAMIRGTHER
jgi:hypothetical protein